MYQSVPAVAPRRAVRLVLLLGLSGIALSACAVGPDYALPTIVLPGQWHHAAALRQVKTTELGEWWRDLGDPTLDRLIERAVAGNLDVAAAKAKIRLARAQWREQAGNLWPSLNGVGSATRSQTPATTSGSGKTTVGNLFQAGLDASWEIDLFGANERAVEAANATAEASEADLQATLLTLVGDVASYYIDARGYQAEIALARRTAESQRSTAKLTRNKFDAGTASAVDVAKADALAATTESDIPAYESALAQSIHRLGLLTGAEPGALLGEMKSSAAVPSARKALPRGIPADLLQRRPDIRAAERRLAAATADIGAAEAARYPSITLSGSISTTGTKTDQLFKASSIAWSWGPSVNVPLFTGGRLEAAVDAAAATRDQTLITWRSTVLSALEDVENALVALSAERVHQDKLSEATRNYRTAAELSRALYTSGSSSFLDVLDAEKSLYSAETSRIASRVSLAKDHVALAKALGGGWVKPVESDKPEVVDETTGPHIRRPN
ncbi:MAG: efflux transporter outer membrane subunit [Ancalomicrobiaceae bacterium]|nr:efflux transporter outer membrane subunit [Ancalomicrobiaceae bacterium]